MRNSIMLVSFFESNNMGDRLICSRMKEEFSKYFNVKCFDFTSVREFVNIDTVSKDKIQHKLAGYIKQCFRIVFPYRSFITYIRTLITTSIRSEKIFRVEKEVDALILGGGNMIMDMAMFPNYTAKVFCILKKAKKYKKKTALVFVGVGPLKNKLHRLYVKRIMKLCDLVITRDYKSKNLLNDICSNLDVEVCYDPVLSVEGHNSQRVNAIGICVFWGMNTKNHQSICNAYVKLINELSYNFPDYKIIMFASELADYKQVYEVYSKISNPNVVIKQVNDERDFLGIYSEIDVLISGRMHGIITSWAMRTPVLGLNWQQKVEGLAEMLDISDNIFNINNFENNIEGITKKINMFIENLPDEIERMDKKMLQITAKIESTFLSVAERI